MNRQTMTLRHFALTVGFSMLTGVCMPAIAQHTADQDNNFEISLSELLRVIQFFNSDGFHCDEFGEDGYAPGPGDTTCPPHDTDYNPQDWEASLSELLRLIQLFNVGEYHCDFAGEDGYATGPGNQNCVPPGVTITAPMEGDFIYASATDDGGSYTEYTLMGYANDVEDGPLTGASLEWTTILDGGDPEVLGTGESLTVKLYSPRCFGAPRSITLTATDSDLNEFSATVNVTMDILCK